MGSIRPNVVFIMADDLGFGDVGCYGSEKIPTPNIDRVAAEGVCFTDAHSSSAVCTPSRYSVLTGRYCWRSSLKSLVGGGYSLPLIDPSRLTIGSLMKREGYATAAIGKWHVGLEWQPKKGKTINYEDWNDTAGAVDYTKPIIGGPTRLGFDYFFGISGSLDMPPYVFIENEHTVGIPSLEKKPYLPQQQKGLMVPDWEDEEVDVTFAQKAIKYIEDHQEEPFFLYLTPSAPHRPCVPPEFLKGSSEAGPRGDMVCLFDWVVGQIDKTLNRLGLKDDTLLIITSDNGAQPADIDGETYDHLSCGSWRGYKSDIWEGGHRVPFIARYPGTIPEKSVNEETICLTDVMATLAELTDSEIPLNAGEDSCTMLSAMTGRENKHCSRKAIIHHSMFGMFAIREGDYKAVFGLGSGGFSGPDAPLSRGYYVPEPIIPEQGGPDGQLYDLKNNPQEEDGENLWLKKAERVKHLEAMLEQYKSDGRSVFQYNK